MTPPVQPRRSRPGTPDLSVERSSLSTNATSWYASRHGRLERLRPPHARHSAAAESRQHLGMLGLQSERESCRTVSGADQGELLTRLGGACAGFMAPSSRTVRVADRTCDLYSVVEFSSRTDMEHRAPQREQSHCVTCAHRSGAASVAADGGGSQAVLHAQITRRSHAELGGTASEQHAPKRVFASKSLDATAARPIWTRPTDADVQREAGVYPSRSPVCLRTRSPSPTARPRFPTECPLSDSVPLMSRAPRRCPSEGGRRLTIRAKGKVEYPGFDPGTSRKFDNYWCAKRAICRVI